MLMPALVAVMGLPPLALSAGETGKKILQPPGGKNGHRSSDD
jgi:hypothetical protein